MAKIHDLFIVELAEVIKGYGNNPDDSDPFRLSEFYRFYELPNIAVSRENFEKMRPVTPERKKGKWIPVTKIYKVTEGQFPNTHIEWVDTTDPDKIDAVRCSECREVFDFQDARNWCTECGADMRDSVETARDIVHEAVNNSVWSDTVDTAKMHKVVDDKYAEMTKKTEESKRCDTCKHEKEPWFNRCADCSDYELWESKDET